MKTLKKILVYFSYLRYVLDVNKKLRLELQNEKDKVKVLYNEIQDNNTSHNNYIVHLKNKNKSLLKDIMYIKELEDTKVNISHLI